MSKKSKRTTSGKPIPAPIQFLKDALRANPQTRDALKKKMEEEKYAIGTINTQLFQLKHWKGCIVDKDGGYAKNPDYVEPAKEKKEKKTAKSGKSMSKPKSARKQKLSSVPKVVRSRTFNPQPKPSQVAV